MPGRVRGPEETSLSDRVRRDSAAGGKGEDEADPGATAGAAPTDAARRKAASIACPLPVLIDRSVGHRLFELCRQGGLDGEALAEILGVSMAEIEDYRSGAAPVPASAVFLAALYFGVGTEFFFAGLSADGSDRKAASSVSPTSAVPSKKRARKSP